MHNVTTLAFARPLQIVPVSGVCQIFTNSASDINCLGSMTFVWTGCLAPA